MQAPSQSRRAIHFGAFQLDLSSGELHKHGIKLRLQEQPFQILAMLLERPGEVVTREQLRRRLWSADTFVDFDVGLNNAILRLRNALGDSTEKPRFIETLPRRGYRFIASVDNGQPSTAQPSVAGDSSGVAQAVRADGIEKSSVEVAMGGASRPLLRKVWFVTTMVAIAGALLFFGLKITRHGGRLLRPRSSARIQSIAVLPLENLTGDPGQEYFVDGMTDALITDLAQIRALRVISRTSAMRYKNVNVKKNLQEIARELGVDAVVEGTVARSGDRVRIDAQLIEAATDRHLWAKSYERDLRDVLALQGEVAQSIASEIQIGVAPPEQARLAKTKPVNPVAYEAYLRGRFHWNRWSVEEAQKALPYFQQAIDIDPNYVSAYCGLSDSYRVLALFGGASSREAWEKAKVAALKAIEIDDTFAEAHRSLAPVRFWYDWNPAASEKEDQRALLLNPGDAETYRTYSVLLRTTGRLSESMAMVKRAQELDPLSPAIGTDAGYTHYFARQYDLAIQQLRSVLELDPNFSHAHWPLGLAYEAQGKSSEAIAEYKQAVSLSPGNLIFLVTLGRAYAVSGQRAQALPILSRVQELSRTRYTSPVQLALFYRALGDKNRAFAWLEKAYQERDDFLLSLSTAPWFDPLRSDARFLDLTRRVQDAEKHQPATAH